MRDDSLGERSVSTRLACHHRSRRHGVSSGVTYLANFPDGGRTIRTHLIGLSLPGTVGVHDPWIVTRVERLDRIVDGQGVSFEVWVKSAPAQGTTRTAGKNELSVSQSAELSGAPTVRFTFQLHDARVSRWDGWWVVGRLRCVGRADETTAAEAIDRALTDRAQGVTLTAAECEAVLTVLIDPPDGLLGLRDELARHRRDHYHG